MTVLFEEECEIPFEFDYKMLAQTVIEKALDEEECPYETEVNLLFVSNKEIRLMNMEHRGIDRETDVLSFPMVLYDTPGEFDFLEDAFECFNPDSGELMLGDIMISVDKVLEQADEYGHSVNREFAFLIAHSMLHLMGYDHMEEAERCTMEEKQSKILEELGINR